MVFSIHQQRYNRRIMWLALAYAALLFLAVYLLSRHLVGGAAAYAIGILPALPVSAAFWMMGRYLVEETDEYLRMLQVRQLLVATALALTASTVWGFLEGFGLAPALPGFAWPVIWLASLAVGACVNLALERTRS